MAVACLALALASCQVDRGPSSLSRQQATPAPPTTMVAPAVSSTPSASPSPVPHAATVTVPFALDGTGDRDLMFESTAKWSIGWSFSCSNLGRAAPFTLRVDGAKGSTHETGAASGIQGNGTVSSDSQDGRFTLTLRSACQWHLAASN